uniref:Histone-arginine methyltransferase METTL23 n=7 Tax=Bos TaxID=9903 RepID=F1MQ97_BOVIN
MRRSPLRTHTHTQTRATAAPRRPSLRPGAFKVAFQKIHSLTTFRASGWTSGCRLPPPPASRDKPLASASPGPALTQTGYPPCWEGQPSRATSSLRPRLSRVRFLFVTSGSEGCLFWLSSGRLPARCTCSVCLVCLVLGSVLAAWSFRRSRGASPACCRVLHLQYGMYVWPCAVVLAQYLWFHRGSLPGKAVLEIGAGVSLPGIVAAKCGAEVTLSDSSELPHCLAICRESCQMNNLPQVHVVGLTWGHVSRDLLALPPQDIILASDVFFEPEDFEDILTTVYFLMQKNPKVKLWSTYQVRSADWSLEALLYKWDMKCVHIPLESFGADKEDIAESALPGRHTVEMLVISFAKDNLNYT